MGYSPIRHDSKQLETWLRKAAVVDRSEDIF